MKLIITSYLDRSPDHVQEHLGDQIAPALQEAAERIGVPETPTLASVDDDHAEVRGGLELLDGAAIDWAGDDDLTTVRVAVSWTPGGDGTGRQVLAANRFAQVLTSRIRDAA